MVQIKKNRTMQDNKLTQMDKRDDGSHYLKNKTRYSAKHGLGNQFIVV